MEETTETINLVLPSSSPLGGGELSDQDLEAVSGAGGSWQILVDFGVACTQLC